MLSITNLHVEVSGKEILKGVSLMLAPGKVYALMGPNGSGKSTLGLTIAGHPKYKVTQGDIQFEGKSIISSSPDERARNGIFLSFQQPRSIPGLPLATLLRASFKAVKKKDIRVFEFHKKIKGTMDVLKFPHLFSERAVNEGLSGGEKKKSEILQALILEPKLIILDEIDSGLDVDALKQVAAGIKKLKNSKAAILVITHYQHILAHIKPDVVTVLKSGTIVASGKKALAKMIEKEGFEQFEAQEPTQKPTATLTILE